MHISVEIAQTEEARTVGLMHREHLPPDAGMVFLFEEPTSSGFWMKDTLIPLSIAFWNAEGSILAILDMDACVADPCPLYLPGVAYMGALEVNQGWFEHRGIGVGARVELVP